MLEESTNFYNLRCASNRRLEQNLKLGQVVKIYNNSDTDGYRYEIVDIENLYSNTGYRYDKVFKLNKLGSNETLFTTIQAIDIYTLSFDEAYTEMMKGKKIQSWLWFHSYDNEDKYIYIDGRKDRFANEKDETVIIDYSLSSFSWRVIE